MISLASSPFHCGTCQYLRLRAPEPCPSNHGARNCAAQRLCDASAPAPKSRSSSAPVKQSTGPRGWKGHGAPDSVGRPAGQRNALRDKTGRGSGTLRGRFKDCRAALFANAVGPGSVSGQCGSRGWWLMDNLQMPATDALQHLAREFPVECGVLAEARCLTKFMQMRIKDPQTGTPEHRMLIN